MLDDFYFVDKAGYLYTDEEKENTDVITPANWLNSYVLHSNVKNLTSILRQKFQLDMRPSSDKVAIMQFKNMIIVYDYLKQVAGFFSLVTGELVFATSVSDTGRFIQFGKRLFFVQACVSEVTLGEVRDLDSQYRLMEKAGWERNRSVETTYQKLTRFVLCHSKALQTSKTSADVITYFAQTQKRVPNVLPSETFKKALKAIQKQISDEQVPGQLDNYNL